VIAHFIKPEEIPRLREIFHEWTEYFPIANGEMGTIVHESPKWLDVLERSLLANTYIKAVYHESPTGVFNSHGLPTKLLTKDDVF
jgi:hypothetical protein